MRRWLLIVLLVLTACSSPPLAPAAQPAPAVALPTFVVVVPPLATRAPQGPSIRTGAICRDGSLSTATGSGACSHHQGVEHWTHSP